MQSFWSCCRTVRALVVLCALNLSSQAFAQALLDDVHTLANNTTAVPIERDFDITVAGDYQIVLTDLGATLPTPAPLASVQLAVTSNDALVGKPLVGAGTLSLTGAKVGSYRLHVIGKPGTAAGSGPIGLQVIHPADSSVVYSFSDTLALTGQAIPSTEGVLDETFTVASAGSYQVSLQDLAFPQPLSASPGPTLLLIEEGGSTPLVILPDVANGNAMQALVQLQTGRNYRLFAVGEVGAGATGGLYSANIIGQAGQGVAISKTVPIGVTTLAGTAVLQTATYNFALQDLSFPTPLTQISAIAVLNGQALVTVPSAATQSVPVTAGTYSVFAVAAPAAASGGSYSLQIGQAGAAPGFSLARGVTAPDSSLTTFSVDAQVASAATFALNLVDFQTPRPLVSGRLAAVQGGAIVGTPLTAPGTTNVSLGASSTSGPVTLLAFGSSGSGGSLMDLNLTAGDGSLLVDQPVGVGIPFAARPVSVTSAGRYTVVANDLAFPAAFNDLAVVVTQGGTVKGSIFASGTIALPGLAAGNYYINFLATPTNTDAAGTYALNVSPAPPAPTVTLIADKASVDPGGTVKLTWTSTNATSCTASGGSWSGTWSGAQAASGSDTSPAISAATTFTLTCTGLGGNGSQSVTVGVNAAPSTSHGGGGRLDFGLLFGLATLLALRLGVRRRV